MQPSSAGRSDVAASPRARPATDERAPADNTQRNRSGVFARLPSPPTLVRLSRHPTIGTASVLATLTVFMCLSRVIHGSFVADDWSYRALAHFNSFGGIVNQQ